MRLHFEGGKLWNVALYSAALLLLVSNAGRSAEDELLWPLKADPALTGTFCEYRSRHFHSGIDVKTYGRIGLPCCAVADGAVVRIRTTPEGYGKVLYFLLNDGRIAVYAHLNGFAPRIDEIVRREQEQTGRYVVDLTLDGDRAVNFKRGEVIGYSGRSGVKHSHLHFELRSNWNEPVNPLVNGYRFPDHRAPTPVAFALTPLDSRSTVEKRHQTRIYDQLYRQEDGVYRVRDPIGITGRIGLSLEVYDQADRSENILAVYRIEMKLDGEVIWITKFDRFTFDQNSQIELERDYRLTRVGEGDFHRLYRATGNSLDVNTGNGIIELGGPEAGSLDVEILISDVAGNKSVVQLEMVSDQVENESRSVGGRPLFDYRGSADEVDGRITIRFLESYFYIVSPPGIAAFEFEQEPGRLVPVAEVDGGVAAVWEPPPGFQGRLLISALDRSGHIAARTDKRFYPVFSDRDTTYLVLDGTYKIEIPEMSVFETMWISIEREPDFQVPGLIEAVCRIEPRDQPLARPVTIGIRKVDHRFESGWGLYFYDTRRGWKFLNCELDGDFYVAETKDWERFGLVRDLDRPVVEFVSPSAGQVVKTRRPFIEVTVMDSTSGLCADSLTMRLDGRIVPAEFDPPRDRIIYQPWHELSIGKHIIETDVSDRVGNRSVKSIQFTVQP